MRCLSIAAFLLAATGQAHAATYYVSPAGNDANSCSTAQSTTASQQKRTISAGVACLSAGDRLYIRGGTYSGLANSINSGATTVRGGTDFGAGAITIAAYPGETVTIAVGSGSLGNAITLTSATQRYLIFDGLTLDGTGMGSFAGGLYVGPGTSHIRFQNGEIRNFPGQGVLSSASAGGHLQLIGNRVHHNGGRTTPQTHNIYLTSSDNLIEGNEIDHGGYFGITIYDGEAEPSRNIIRYNHLHDNCINGGAEIGIAGGRGNAVYGNVVSGGSNCFALDVEFASPDATLVYSNTFVLTAGIRIGPDATNTVLENNIIRLTNNGGAGPIVNEGRSSVIANNLRSDPKFVSVAKGDFRLLATSAAIDAAVGSRVPPYDINGVTRPQGGGPDIGAYEFLQESTLTAPANLRVVTSSTD